MSPDIETLQKALRQVIDPEVGVNIVDLGLVYALDVDEQGVRARITMTSPACPMGEGILAEAEAVLQDVVAAATPVEVRLVWDPPWTPDLMSERAKKVLGW